MTCIRQSDVLERAYAGGNVPEREVRVRILDMVHVMVFMSVPAA